MKMRFLILLALACPYGANAATPDRWYGKYTYEETGINATASRSWVETYTLEIEPDNGQIVATYKPFDNGDLWEHSVARWIGHESGNTLSLIYDRCVPAPEEVTCEDSFARGTLMLKLVRVFEPKRGMVIRTHFQAFKRQGDPRPGGVYFQKESK